MTLLVQTTSRLKNHIDSSECIKDIEVIHDEKEANIMGEIADTDKRPGKLGRKSHAHTHGHTHGHTDTHAHTPAHTATHNAVHTAQDIPWGR